MEANNYEKIVELYKMLGEQEDLLNVFYTNDYPVPFKSLKIYPVQMDLYFYFQVFSQCLLEPHKTSGDIKAISMSYLRYLCYLGTDKQRPEILVFLSELISMVFKIPKFVKNDKGEKTYNIDINFDEAIIRVGEETINEKEFDTFRKIVLEQNALELPDETLNPELVKAYKELEQFKQKQSNVKMCDIEGQIDIVIAQTSYRKDEILKMTIRTFSHLFERLLMITNYEIQSLLTPYMEKKDQKNITHYLADNHRTLKERIEKESMDESSLRKIIDGGQ